MPNAPVTRLYDAERDRSRSKKRERILDAAIKVFARAGYHGSRVSDIAREAGIAYGLVYHYFKNKEEILGSIFEQRWSGFLSALERIAAEDGAARDKLARVAARIFDAYRQNPDWVKVLVIEIQRSSRFAEPGQIRAVGELFRIVERIVEAGQAQGELRRDVNPKVASTVFCGSLEIAITSLVLHLVESDDEESYYVETARSLVDVFLNGMAAEGPAG